MPPASRAGWMPTSFNFSAFGGDKTWVAGVELAPAGEPLAHKPRTLGASPFGRQPQPPLRCDLLLKHA